MTKKRKSRGGLTRTGVNLIVANAAVGAVPNISGTAAETNLKNSYSQGLANAGSYLPTYGKVQGVRMILKPLGKLKKKSSRLLKGSKRL